MPMSNFWLLPRRVSCQPKSSIRYASRPTLDRLVKWHGLWAKEETLTSLEHWRATDTRKGVRTLLEDQNCTAGAHLIHPAATQSCTSLTSSSSRQTSIQQRTLQRRIDGRVHHLDFDTLICARTAMAGHTSKICQFLLGEHEQYPDHARINLTLGAT